MNYKLRTNKAFTLIELVVAVALLAMILSFSGVIFKGSIGAHRLADANAEIMQKLRAITDQLNADFKGLRADAPLLIWFREDKSNPAQRYDQIMFFADGDFQSTQLYESGTSREPIIPIDKEPQSAYKLIRGNVARIYYGQAQVYSKRNRDFVQPWEQKYENPQDDPILNIRKRILGRRRHILTADEKLEEWPNDGATNFDEKDNGILKNELYEHDSLSLAQWKIIEGSIYENKIISECFSEENLPAIDSTDPATFHKLMCNGVSSFAVQWAYWDWYYYELRWFPGNYPDGSGTYSHFDSKNKKDMFGVFFNVPNGSHFADWYPVGDTNVKYNDFGNKFSSGFYPEALKFTFRLYDSKGVIKEGREFTHIVYIGD